MKVFLASIVLLLPLGLSAEPVTYIAPNFSITLPDFLPKLYPGVNTYIFHPDQLDSCGRPGQQCAFAGFTYYETEDGAMTVTYAEVISPDQNVYEPSSAFLNLNLSQYGTYECAGCGRLIIRPAATTAITAADPITRTPEPSTSGLMGSALALAGLARRHSCPER
jgi:hypothetical protein